MEQSSFNDIITDIDAETILDVGCGGLGGENTSDYLIAKWGTKVHGVCKDPQAKVYADSKGIRMDIALFDPNNYGKYDLVVFDPGITYNLAWWRNPSAKNTNKYFTTYIMLDENYGDKNDHRDIKETWDQVWGGFPTVERILMKDYSPFKLKKYLIETRRPEIVWVLLEL